MAFRVYPSEINKPLSLKAQTGSSFVLFEELVGHGNPPVMFLRLVKLGGGEAPGPPRPTVHLRAHATSDGGHPPGGTRLSKDDNQKVPVVNRAGADVAPIAFASYQEETQGVFLIRVEFTEYEPSRWWIQIGNDDYVERRYTWVVADNEEETAQPWINVQRTVGLTAVHDRGQLTADSETVGIDNYGTGPLILEPPDFSGEPFQLDLPEDPIPPNMSASLSISYLGTETELQVDGYLELISNDDRADGSTDHNSYVELTGSTRQVSHDGHDDGHDVDPGPGWGRCRCCRWCGSFKYEPLWKDRCARKDCGHRLDDHEPPR